MVEGKPVSQIFSENMLATGDRLCGTELEGGQMVHMALSNRRYFPSRPVIVKMLRDDG